MTTGKGAIHRAAEVTLSGKRPQSRTRQRTVRSTETKPRTRVGRNREPQAALIKKLKAHAHDLKKKLEARTHELSEALEQQTATSEVLGVISRSPGELKPVFQAMLANAVRICEAGFGTLFRCNGDRIEHAASVGTPRALVEFHKQRGPFRPEPGQGLLGRVFHTREVAHTVDYAAEVFHSVDTAEAYLPPPVRLGGARSAIAVPMLKDNELVGAIVIYRQEVRPFTQQAGRAAQNFAAQAVIAIENARLLTELRETLQQQTATADVLKVISRSTFDLQTVFDTLIQSAAQLSHADKANLWRLNGRQPPACRVLRIPVRFCGPRAHASDEPRPRLGLRKGRARRRNCPFPRRSGRSGIHRVRRSENWELSDSARRSASARGSSRSATLFLSRAVVDPFTQQQIELVDTFADQAVIAIENVRLFDEIQDKSRQLAEASQHKSQFLANMSHELRTPLNAIIGVTEMLREDAEAAKQDLEPLDRVLGAGRHLLALINDILDLSKIEAGRMELHLESFSLTPLIEDVAKTIEPLASKNEQSDCRRLRFGPRHDPRRPDPVPAGTAQPREQREQVHRERHGHHRRAAAAARRPRLGHDRRDRHRHRHDDRADGQAVPGVLPGVVHYGEQIRRHRSRPRHQPAFLPHDGRRHHGRKRARPRLDLHDPAASDCGSPNEVMVARPATAGMEA